MGPKGAKALAYSLALVTLYAIPANACQCAVVIDELGNAAPLFNRLSYSRADIVFLGKADAVDTSTGSGTATYTFRISKWVKGKADRSGQQVVAIQTNLSSAACGETFEMGAEYLVLGRKSENRFRVFETDNCSGNSLLSKEILDSASAYARQAGEMKKKGRRK